MRLLGFGMVFALAVGLPVAAQAQNVCNAQLNVDYVSGPSFGIAGSAYTVEVGIGTGSITGGANNQITMSQWRFELDCANNPFIGCVDEGAIVSYSGDATISVQGTGCVDINGTPVGFSSNNVAGGTAPNQVVFTPTAPVVMDANVNPTSDAACKVQFGITIANAPGTDATPLLVQESAGFIATPPFDAVCDQPNPIPGTAAQSGQIPLCQACDDGNSCTTESCNTGSGACETTFTQTCDDGNACTTEACNTASGQCETSFTQTCNDGNACTTEACNTANGACETSFTQQCGDGNACTSEICNTSTGQCQTTNTQTCNDNNACTTEACNTANGQCETSFTQICNDGNACTTEACNTATGACQTSFTQTCNDGNACTTEACNTATGACQTSFTVTCTDPTCEECNTATGVCQDRDPQPPICNPMEICRTPGFWKTHAGSEKGGPNVTGTVLAASTVPVIVCGDLVSDSVDVMENMCVQVRGNPLVQLKRQLTAAALNCIMSTGNGDCTGVSIESLFADCNAACVGGTSTRTPSQCIGEIDAFNNGLTTEPSCHEQPLCNEDIALCIGKTGPASSPRQCSDISKGN